MTVTYYLLFDTGTFTDCPGFPPGYFFSDLPAAGGFTGLEISAANILSFPSAHCGIVTVPKRVKVLEDKIKDYSIDIDIIPYEHDIQRVIDVILKKDPASLIIQNMSSLLTLDSGSLQNMIKTLADTQLIKCSVGTVPVDLFLCTGRFFSNVLSSLRKEGRDRTAEGLFAHLLLHFTDQREISGTLFLHTTIYSLYNSYRKCVDAPTFLHPDLHRLYERKPKDSEIGRTGSVKNSLFSPGGRIDGYVENSFLFTNVTVREGAKIIDSVIFPGHTIGKKAVVKNAVLLPFTLEPSPGTTIGDKSIIGGMSKAVNKDYPEQVHSGLSVIGFDIEVPGGTVMEPASCIGWGAAKSDIKQRKVIKKGSCLTGKEQ